MLRITLAFCLAVACGAFTPAPTLQLSQLSASRASLSMMARAAPKKAAKAAKTAKKAAPKPVAKKVVAKKVVAKKAAPKPVPKKAPAKKSFGKSPKGKGGIFPWITNEPGTYAKVMSLSSVDFTGDDGDKWIGWGFMPKSVKALYPKGYKGLLNK